MRLGVLCISKVLRLIRWPGIASRAVEGKLYLSKHTIRHFTSPLLFTYTYIHASLPPANKWNNSFQLQPFRASGFSAYHRELHFWHLTSRLNQFWYDLPYYYTFTPHPSSNSRLIPGRVVNQGNQIYINKYHRLFLIYYYYIINVFSAAYPRLGKLIPGLGVPLLWTTLKRKLFT